jgi:hypothetical protein
LTKDFFNDQSTLAVTNESLESLVRLPALAVFAYALSYPLPVIVMFFVRSPVFGSTSITLRLGPPGSPV